MLNVRFVLICVCLVAQVMGSYARAQTFEANLGQVDKEALFIVRASGYQCYVTRDGLVFSLPGKGEWSYARMRLMGANPGARVVHKDRQIAVSNYFLGNDPNEWRTGVPHYRRIVVEEVYPGIDLVYLTHQGQVQYDFVLRPGARAEAIRLLFEGASDMRINGSGDLELITDAGLLVQRCPELYQETKIGRSIITGRFVMLSESEVGFTVGRYDKRQTLVIDPTITFSSFYGGAADDQFRDVAAHSSGKYYMTGYTLSLNYPTHNPIQPGRAGMEDAVVVKMNHNNQVEFSTYFGGSRSDLATGIAVTDAEDVYMVGITASLNFPLANALQSGFQGGGFDNFVVGLSSNGQSLLFSTYLGGNGLEFLPKAGVDAAGNVYLTGQTSSTNYPTTPHALQPANAGQEDGFLTVIKPNPYALAYSTYFGGSGPDYGSGIYVDRTTTGKVAATGASFSNNFPVSGNAVQPTRNGGSDAIFRFWTMNVDAGTAAVKHSTYLGGSLDDSGQAVAKLGNGLFIVAGTTLSSNFPTVNPLQSYAGATDAFVSAIDPNLAGSSALEFSTHMGGSNQDVIASVAPSAKPNEVYMAGGTTSTDIPVTPNAVQSQLRGLENWWLLNLKVRAFPEGTFNSYLGDSGSSTAMALVALLLGDELFGASDRQEVVVVGMTNGANFPTVNPVQGTYGGGIGDGVIVRLSFPLPPLGDVNGDGCVDDTDLARILSLFGSSGALPEDVNGDGIVDDTDLAIVLENFGTGC